MGDEKKKEEEQKKKEKDQKVAKIFLYTIAFLVMVLILVSYRSCTTTKTKHAINDTYEIPEGLEEIKDDVDKKSDFAVVSKSFSLRSNDRKVETKLADEFTPAYKDYDNSYIEEYLSDGDIDGINANDVARLQRFLRSQGYKVRVDGMFRRQTKQALKAFQRSYGIRADGVVGYKTRRLINRLVAQQR